MFGNKRSVFNLQTNFGIGEERLDAVRGKVFPDLEAHLVVGAEELVPSEEGRGPAVVVRHPRMSNIGKCVTGSSWFSEFGSINYMQYSM